jgi:hypothetical protein
LTAPDVTSAAPAPERPLVDHPNHELGADDAGANRDPVPGGVVRGVLHHVDERPLELSGHRH